MILVIWVHCEFSCFAVKLYNPQSYAAYSDTLRTAIWSKYVHWNNLSRCDIAKSFIITLNLTWVKHFDVSVFMCVLKKVRESSTPLLTAEITAPAGLRTVLHHEGSWIHDVTFEPQPGPDQMLDFLIKYLSAPVNYPTSVWQFDGHYKTGCWPSTEHCPFPHSTLVHLR